MPWCITLDNSKGISRLRFWAKNRRVNGINDLPVFMHQGNSAPASQPSALRLLLSSNVSSQLGSSCSVLYRCALRFSMTSADFCSSIATLLSVASPVADKQISQGKARDFIRRCCTARSKSLTSLCRS